MKYRKTVGGIVFNSLNIMLMVLFAVICLLPIWHTLCSSFSMPYDLSRTSGLVMWPAGRFTTQGYEMVFQNKGVWNGYINTIINALLHDDSGIDLSNDQ